MITKLLFLAIVSMEAPELAQYNDLVKPSPINQTHLRRDGRYPWTGDQDADWNELHHLWMLDAEIVTATQATIASVTASTVLTIGTETNIFTIPANFFAIESDLDCYYEAYRYYYWNSAENPATMIFDAQYGDLHIDGVFSATNTPMWDQAYSDRLQWDGGPTNLVAATGRSSLGLGSAATRNAEDTLTNGSNLPDGAAVVSYVTGLGYWDSVDDTPRATPNNGDITHLSTADQIYDFVTGQGYISSTLAANLDANEFNITDIGILDVHSVYSIENTLSSDIDITADGSIKTYFGSSSEYKIYGQWTNPEASLLSISDSQTRLLYDNDMDGSLYFGVLNGSGGSMGPVMTLSSSEGIYCSTGVKIVAQGLGVNRNRPVAGSVDISGSYLTNGSDFGEWFISRESIPVGRFVALDSSIDRGVRIAEATDFFVIGVTTDGSAGFYGDNASRENGGIAVGLLGKLVVDVSPGVELRRGDPVTVGVEGMAMHANCAARPTYLYKYATGQPVAYAIEDQRQGRVTVFFK